MLSRFRETKLAGANKFPPLIEDLRNHTTAQLAELHALLAAGVEGRRDSRRPGFFELEGAANVYYIFRYPAGHKVLLLAAWQREIDPVAEMVAYSCPAA